MSTSNENLIISQEKNEDKKLVRLLYYFRNNVTSQDPLYPLNNLLNKNNKIGWISNRFCTYPQETIVEFHSYVYIKQINILINESKIPTLIEFINCVYLPNKNIQLKEGELATKKNYKPEFQYKNMGFIKLSSNVETSYNARELRKIYVNILTNKIKLIVHKNYSNSINTFCQVGIVSLDFYGFILNNDINNKENNNKKLNYADLFLSEEIEGVDDSFFDKQMDKKSREKLKELMEEMQKKKECEEYDECKIIKKEIDQLKKITFKIYNLELYKNDCVKRNDFDNAKIIKKDIEIFKRMLNGYLNKNYEHKNKENQETEKNLKINSEENKMNDDNTSNTNLNRKIRISRTQQDIFNSPEQNFDNLILPTLQRKKNSNLNSISNINNSISFENSLNSSGHYESIIGLNENEQIERKPLEELSQEIKTKYEILTNILGEETMRKIFSKYIYYKEEGFDTLNLNAKSIITDSKKTTQDTNKYIVSLINIFFFFLDDRHPSIVCKCLELFINILKAIKERSSSNKTEYDFKITKKILNKIKGKLNHISKKVRLKASELYCYMLETDFCEYNSLILELVETDVNDYFNKLGILNNNNYNFQMSTSKGVLGIGSSGNLKPDQSKQLIITKMNIFLEIFTNFEKNKKFDMKKFPKNIVGDFIIININHPKEEVRDVTKEVLIKYIHIFGNQIMLKLKMFIKNKELTKLIQDKEELKNQLILVRAEEMKKNYIKNELSSQNISQNHLNRNQKLNPISGIDNNNLKKQSSKGQKSKKLNNKLIIKSSSQPKYPISNKIKLKPINIKANFKQKNSNASKNNIISINSSKKINESPNNDVIKNDLDKKEESKNQENGL